MDERTRRIGENEALFREINERMNDLNQQFKVAGELFQIVCECGAASCVERVDMPLDDYRSLRADPTHFAVVPGHEAPDVESVVARRDGYDVVRKHPGDPARLAEATEPA